MFFWRRWLEEQSRLQARASIFKRPEKRRSRSDTTGSVTPGNVAGEDSLKEKDRDSGSGCQDDHGRSS